MLKKAKRKIEIDILIAFAVLVGVVSIGATFYHLHESLRWVDAYYFTMMTVLTVGYGDFVPRDDVSKIVTTIYSLIGIPAVLFALGILVEDFLENRIEKLELRVNKVLREENEVLKEETEILKDEEKRQ